MTTQAHYSKSDIESAFSRVAWIYDIWGRFTESKALARALEFASIRDGESVLEVAVGTGGLFEKIVRANPHGRNEGLDISQSMLNKARARLAKYSIFNLMHGDAANLPYDDNSFDVLVNCYMLDLLPGEDHHGILQEFKRVLKPNGRLVIASMTNGREWYSRVWDIVARRAPALLTGCRPIDSASVIKSVGFTIENSEYVTQSTFPSLVLYARRQ